MTLEAISVESRASQARLWCIEECEFQSRDHYLEKFNSEGKEENGSWKGPRYKGGIMMMMIF